MHEKSALMPVLSCVMILIFTRLIFPQIDTQKHTIDTALDGGYWIDAVDFDKDGDVDIVAASLRSGLKWYKNNGSGNFTRQNITDNFAGAWSVHAVDVDSDGDLDAVTCSAELNQVAWFENMGDGTFNKHVVDNVSEEPQSIYSADLDGDNDIDILAAAWKSKQIFWLENDGNESFTKHVLDNNFNSAHSVYAADLNNNNRIDILAGGGGTTAWWRNDGNGNFTKKSVDAVGTFFVLAADIDGDGFKDVLRNQRDNGDIDWFKNNTGSTFTEKIVHSTFGETWSAAVGDFDTDGDKDILAAGFVPNKVSYWLNDGNQNFSEVVLDASLTRPRSVAVADFDKDGDDDMATVTRADKVIWYEVLGSPTVQASITLTSPNGGESFEMGANTNIQWTHTGVINNVKLEYSTNGGNNWNVIIASTANTGSFPWTVPNVQTTTALVRVSDATNAAISDTSDAVFAITGLGLTITSPNGGESWPSGSTQTITWTSTGTINSVKIEYSVNNGASWILISASEPNNGSYIWSVPAIQTTNALVRISEAVNGTPSDVSDGIFSIEVSSLTLLSPNGGEILPGASTQTITWTSTGQINTVKLEYSLNNGGSWVPIIHSTLNNGSYNWTVPNIPSTTVLVKVSDATDGTPSDQSNSTFTILRTSLSLLVPNGNENWFGGTTQTVRWTTTGPIDSVKIEYSWDNGASWTTIVNNLPNVNSYNWNIPNINSTNVLLRISDAPDGLPSDVSDAVFIITASELFLTSPNGGENWYGGSLHNITWTSSGLVDSVKIEYSSDNGTSWSVIINQIDNTGSFPWRVPEVQTNSMLIRISDAADSNPTDQSDAVFSVTKTSLVITAPNGSEILLGEGTSKITWNSVGPIDSVKLEYSLNNGLNWLLLAAPVANTGQYTWDIPNIRTDQALVKISDFTDGIPVDASDAVFTIISSSLTITSPNGGETWEKGGTENITWHSTGIIDLINLDYSLNNGGTWTSIADSLPNTGSYSWSVPDVESDSALIRISDFHGMFSPDISDGMFTIKLIISDISINQNSNQLPEQFELFQNYPNPFNLETKIQFAVPQPSRVTLKLYNMRGEQIHTLFEGQLLPGVYTKVWNGRDLNGKVLSSGLYIYKIQIGGWQATKKLLLVK